MGVGFHHTMVAGSHKGVEWCMVHVSLFGSRKWEMKTKQKGLPSCGYGSEVILKTAEHGERQCPFHWAQRGLEWTLPSAGLPGE